MDPEMKDSTTLISIILFFFFKVYVVFLCARKRSPINWQLQCLGRFLPFPLLVFCLFFFPFFSPFFLNLEKSQVPFIRQKGKGIQNKILLIYKMVASAAAGWLVFALHKELFYFNVQCAGGWWIEMMWPIEY